MKAPARHLTAFLGCFALFLAGGCHPTARTYQVNLSVPAKVGEKSSLVSINTTTLATVVNLSSLGQPTSQVTQEQQKRVVHLEADAETLAVFPNGSVQKAVLTIKVLRVKLDDKPEQDLLPAGSKIVADATTSETVYTVNGEPASTDLAAILPLVFQPGNPDLTDQQKLGPNDSVAIGDSWPVNGDLFASQFADSFGHAINCTGMVRLDGVSGEGDHQVAAVSGAITLHGLKSPLDAPYVTKVGDSSAELHTSLTAAHHGTDTWNMAMSFKFVSESPGPGGGTLTATIDMAGKRENTVIYH